jgi:DNA-directed RNA polymerase sigma subunit (sigma70/sigma32)
MYSSNHVKTLMEESVMEREWAEQPGAHVAPMLQQDIAAELGITRHEVAAIERSAMRKLRALFAAAGYSADDLGRLL